MSKRMFSYCIDLPEPLKKQEFDELFKQMRNGDINAKEKLILHNLRLVIYLVMEKFDNTEYEIEDLISIGKIGLMKAFNNYDIFSQTTFSSYAGTCISNEILMSLRKIKKKVDLVDLAHLVYLRKDNEYAKLSEVIISDIDIIGEYERKVVLAIIHDVIKELPDLERQCIIMSFGLYDSEKITQSEIAEKLNVSRNIVIRALKRGLEKIKEVLGRLEIIEGMEEYGVADKTSTKLSRKRKNTHTIYELLSPYSKELIDLMLSKLTLEEQKLIQLRYGEDLENPTKAIEISAKDYKMFYTFLLPKMRRMLANPIKKYKPCLQKVYQK